ncbi:MAG: hypothetical protein KA715_09065 [Xanthomonadaceae bacterium]|nr:hypothetical protein [Xanthomonadaceae bacterium]
MWATHFSKKQPGRKARLDIKLKRVPIELVVTGFETLTIPGHLLLNDMTPKGFAIYTATRLTEDQEITIKVKEPRMFDLKGTVVFCVENLSDSHIVSEKVYTQRTGIIMKFGSDAERVKYMALLTDLQAHYLGIVGDEPVAAPLATVTPIAGSPADAAPSQAGETPPVADGGALPQAA